MPPSDEIEIVHRKKPKETQITFFGSEEIPAMPSVGEGFNVPVTGSTHDERGYRYTADFLIHRKLVERLVGKIRKNAQKIVDLESHNIKKCDVGVVSYGCTSRAVYETVKLAKEKGIDIGFVRLRTIWPFHEDVIQTMAQSAKVIFVPEMNLQQIFYEVERVVHGNVPVFSINRIGGGKMMTPEELLSEILRRVGKVD